MAGEVEECLKKGDVFIPTEVIAEAVYVLRGVYKVPREEIAAVILSFLTTMNLTVTNDAVLRKSLETYAETLLDFVDCLMVGYSLAGFKILTFDKKLKKNIDKLKLIE